MEVYESIAAPNSIFTASKALGSSRGREAHENGITESKALRNLCQTFNLSNTTPTGAPSALFTKAATGGPL